MSSQLTRRDWLRASGLMTAGLSLSQFNTAEAASSVKRIQSEFTNEFAFTTAPPDMPKLRARLLANENPLGIAPSAKEALVKAADLGNRYAWMEFGQLKELIATDEGVKATNIMMSPGSSDILMAAADHFAKAGGTILTSAFTYDDLLRRAEKMGAKIKAIPMTKDYKYDLPAIKASLTPDVKLVYIVNPNNPTGTIVPTAELEAFCREVAPKVPVFLDEAYIDFYEPADRPKLGKLVADGQNVILARTFSKIHGFAGLRLGYAIAQPEMLKTLHAYTNGDFAVSITTLMAGIASYKDKEWQNHCRAENAKARTYTTKALADMGYEVIPSAANFILFPIRMKPKTFENQMFANGIGIQTRELNGQPFCRVSVGTSEEMVMFVDSFKKVVG
ncbi:MULTISPECIES: pyridoxal phosphate-dependent aminotransferase [Spirosoma]|uniref:Aminotransferase class I/II-fold pyridoxal phosphate-dependent enzyme n=1 Tax=Spirosoma liriopis TaxID=2937440 RepID=A0ABT0HGY8_9BACT|nr:MULTISPECIES: aminotransferase class I/II-fold pyridoxal phosphate-dependent enzyme [Spirosoma]MCK8491419.1 aminotransferase class I/II-fold pyridoxal phosphate-dependent enzyme [Spirosoma liriopis]UHG90789.1 aminotransferase class I/II-fold pyridoxal phosphate-dependent enzyme [Spirosoma oryzicola]